MEQVEKAYEKARESDILPGYAIIAGDKNGTEEFLPFIPNKHLNKLRAKSYTPTPTAPNPSTQIQPAPSSSTQSAPSPP
jgi:hypothetical protein